MQYLLGRIGQRMAEQYDGQSAAIPAERAATLTELLNAKGIMAELTSSRTVSSFMSIPARTMSWLVRTVRSATWKRT